MRRMLFAIALGSALLAGCSASRVNSPSKPANNSTTPTDPELMMRAMNNTLVVSAEEQPRANGS